MKDISKEETEKHFIELNKEIDEKIKMTTETGKHEFVSFCIIALGAFPKEKRNQLIEQAFPKNKQSIIDYFNNREK